MDKSTLENYVSQGLSTSKIAKITNKSQTTVRRWLKRFNLKTISSFLKPKNIEEGIEYKTCARCKEKKQLIRDFYNGGQGWCKICSGENTILLQRKRKIEAINYKGGKCIKCGYDKYPGALDFHHLDPYQKDFSISRKKNCSFESIK